MSTGLARPSLSPQPLPARGLLVDLDDTLYDYTPADTHARGVLARLLSSELALLEDEVAARLGRARDAVKARLGERASSHSRLLYLAELVHALGRPDLLTRVRHWERAYWSAFLSVAELRRGARELLGAFRERGGRVAIVTDLTLEVQLWKLEVLGLQPFVDALVASEEVPFDKPATEAFLLAAERLGLPPGECIMLGDSPSKDGEGARRLGIRYFQVRSSSGTAGGQELDRLREEITP